MRVAVDTDFGSGREGGGHRAASGFSTAWLVYP